MGRHVADKRTPTNGGRVKQFLRLDRQEGEVWRRLARARPAAKGEGRRVAEFARIERGREA